RLRDTSRFAAPENRRRRAYELRVRCGGGHRRRLVARPQHRLRAPGATRRALPRCTEPRAFCRLAQPLSAHQTAGSAVSALPPAVVAHPTSVPASPALILRSSEFRRGREESWRELEALIGRAERRGVRALSAEELQRLPLLYRSTLSSLSVARSIALDRNLLLYLENLTLRSFLCVYGPRTSVFEGVVDFFRRGFPAAARAVRWHFVIAFVCLL